MNKKSFFLLFLLPAVWFVCLFSSTAFGAEQEDSSIAANGQVILVFRDEDGKSIKDDVILSGKLQTTFKIDVPQIAEYEFLKSDSELEGTFSMGTQAITLTYKNKNITKGSVSVNFVDEEGNKLKDEKIYSGRLGSDYKINSSDISGYELINTLGTTEGKYSETSQKLQFIYRKIKPLDASITAVYVDEDGNKLKDDIIYSGKSGNTYKIEPEKIAGYELKETKGNKEGIFNETLQTVTFIYKKSEVATGIVTIIYVDENGNKLRTNDIYSGKVGEGYKLEARKITGYQLKEVKGSLEGKYSDVGQMMTLVYKKETAATKSTSKDASLPKTGEHKQNAIISILGVFLLGSVLYLYIRNKPVK